MKKIFFFFFFILFSSILTAQTPLLWRTAENIKAKEILVKEAWFYTNFTKDYNWNKKEYVALSGENSKLSTFTILGYGITDKIEVLLQIPVTKMSATSPGSGNFNTAIGFGDMSVMARFQMLNVENVFKGNFLLYGQYATSNPSLDPLVDGGSNGVGGGVSLTSERIKDHFVGHVRLGYINNGKADGRRLGNDLLGFAQLDYDYNEQIRGGVTYHYEHTSKKTTRKGELVDDSFKKFHSLAPFIEYVPIKDLFIKLKFKFPLASSNIGGMLPDYHVLLETWYVF